MTTIRLTSENVTTALARNGKNRADLILMVFAGESLAGQNLVADEATNGLLSRRIKLEQFDANSFGVRVIDSDLTVKGLNHVVLVGCGSRSKLTPDALRKVLADAFTSARDAGAERVVFPLIEADLPRITVEQCAHIAAEYALLADYEPNHQKTRAWPGEAEQTHLAALTLVSAQDTSAAAKRGLTIGRKFATATNNARDWVNEPSNTFTPAKMARVARSIARDSKGTITCKVIGKAKMKKLGMGGILAVDAGSKNAPAFIDMRYDPPGGPTETVVGLVGKGITFDSGGLGIKDGDNMKDMKDDMGGAAAVIAVMSLLPLIKPGVSVRAVVAACENLVDSKSMRPGDVLTTMSGLTVEVGHTDAEGRLTLADALHYVQHVSKATEIVDLATLTGSVDEALGGLVSGVFANNKRLVSRFLKSATLAGEPMHELPLPAEYRDGNKSQMADLTNDGEGPGAIIAAWFLCEFVEKGVPWVHVDIASTSFRRYAHGVDPQGGTGVGVRTLARLLMSY